MRDLPMTAEGPVLCNGDHCILYLFQVEQNDYCYVFCIQRNLLCGLGVVRNKFVMTCNCRYPAGTINYYRWTDGLENRWMKEWMKMFYVTFPLAHCQEDMNGVNKFRKSCTKDLQMQVRGWILTLDPRPKLQSMFLTESSPDRR